MSIKILKQENGCTLESFIFKGPFGEEESLEFRFLDSKGTYYQIPTFRDIGVNIKTRAGGYFNDKVAPWTQKEIDETFDKLQKQSIEILKKL